MVYVMIKPINLFFELNNKKVVYIGCKEFQLKYFYIKNHIDIKVVSTYILKS
ncbi:Hypothetical protein NF53_p6162 (plasmid) [Bacillus thuringiensis serovar indiana]|nr:Hypothetical protein NF53_p6162 [Bacillus thuringiensis serovar indiana]